jgi:hypothetical protein
MFRNITSVVALIITILAAINVYGDFSEVEAQARAVAASEGEETHLSQVSRNPISHTYVFAVKGRVTVTVSCSRSAILFGDYSCKVAD